MDRELMLRTHIRTLLLDYCLTHLTTNYVIFTEKTVTDLLSQSLSPVPVADPNSFTLPTDPLDTLLKSVPVSSPEAVTEDIWFTDADAIKHIKSALNISTAKPMSQVCWEEEGGTDFEYFRPMSPILSNRATRETPKFGSLSTSILPNSLFGFAETYLPSSLSIPGTLESDMAIPDVEDILNIKHAVTPTTHDEILALLKKIPAYSISNTDFSNRYIETFLRCDSPPIRFVSLDIPPIFPRRYKSGFDITSPPCRLLDLSDLPVLAPLAQIEEEDVCMEHMAVVNGWQAYAPISSPSPTPSLNEDDSSQIDELFLLSPPNKNYNSALDFESARMDEVQIARCNRIRQGAKKPRLGEEKSISAFLESPLGPLVVPTALRPQHPPARDDSDVGFSVLGQPPSAITGPDSAEDGQDDGSDYEVAKIWKQVRQADFADVILQDDLDTKDEMLMRVPELLPPPFRSTATFLPQNLRTLVSATTHEGEGIKPIETLKEVKGIKPLNLELSWIPFKFGKTIPTHEEAAAISEGPLADLNHKTKVDHLLDQAFADRTPMASALVRSFTLIDEDEDENIFDILSKDHLYTTDVILTREERLNAAGVQRGLGHSQDNDNIHDLDYEVRRPDYDLRMEGFQLGNKGGCDNSRADQPNYNHKRILDLIRPTDEGCSYGEEGTVATQPPAKRIKLPRSYTAEADSSYEGNNFHDSGVLFPHDLGAEGNVDLEFIGAADVASPFRYNTQDDYIMLDLTESPDVNSDGFYPLSFGSTQQARTLLHDPESRQDHYFEDMDHDTLEDRIDALPLPLGGDGAVLTQEVSTKLPFLSVPGEHGPTESRSKHEFMDFLKLRGKTITTAKINAEPPQTTIPDTLGQTYAPPAIPDDMFDRNTLRLSSPLIPRKAHQYLASFNLIQKRALVRALVSQECAIDLIERDNLGDADLILDHETAVVFISLMTVPSEWEVLSDRLSRLSWRFKHLLVVFENFPVARAYKNNEIPRRLDLFAFTPPVVKAIRKLRRGLGIAEGSGTKRVDSTVMWAFADDVGEAAMYARIFGDAAEGRDGTDGMLWEPRDWRLQNEGEEFEGEADLAGVEGLNTFVACVILSQVTLESFLDMTPESKINRFSSILGVDRMVHINDFLLQRFEAVQSSSPLPDSDFQDSSSGRNRASTC